MIPDYFTEPCLRCHGIVEDAPQSLIDRYGKTSGYRFQAGDLAGREEKEFKGKREENDF